MKPTKSFVVEVRSHRRNTKPAEQSIWGGLNLREMMPFEPAEEEAQPEPAHVAADTLARPVLNRRVLEAIPEIVPEPAAIVEPAPEPPAPAIAKRHMVERDPVERIVPEPVMRQRARPEPVPVEPEAVMQEPAPVSEAPRAEPAARYVRRSQRQADKLPPGQKWKRRLPKVLRQS